MRDPILVVLLESNAIQREGIVSTLRSRGFSSCVGVSVLEDLYKHEPAAGSRYVFLIELDRPYDALALTVNELHSRYPGCVVVILAQTCSTPVLRQVVRSEADGLILKQIECDALAKSLELVLLGERVFPASSLRELSETYSDDTGEHDPSEQARLGHLSARERQILLGLEAGHSNKTIARTFAITESTVKVHVKAILRKIAVSNRTQAAVWAKQTRLRSTPDEPAANVAHMRTASAPVRLSDQAAKKSPSPTRGHA